MRGKGKKSLNVEPNTSRDTASLSGCGAEQKQRRADGCQRAASARRSLGSGMMISSVLRLQPVTVKDETRKPRWRHKIRRSDGAAAGLKRADGSYPKNYVEAEDEVLDAAAHFMSLEVLPGNHRDGWLLFVSIVTTNLSEELSGRSDSHPPCCQCLTAPRIFIILSAEASTKRRRCFSDRSST